MENSNMWSEGNSALYAHMGKEERLKIRDRRFCLKKTEKEGCGPHNKTILRD